MIERNFIAQKTKEYYIKKYIEEKLKGVGISEIKLKKIPLGEKIIISAFKPSLVVGSKGNNIKDLSKVLKQKFKLENPQIEINEVKDVYLDANIVANKIASSLEKFGSARFKGVGHKMMENVLRAGALGVEVVVSGKIPSARAKSWRFYQGYLKKCGDIAQVGVRKAQASALLKSGVVGIKVAIMPPNLELPDSIEILKEAIKVEEVIEEGPKKGKGKKSKSDKEEKKADRAKEGAAKEGTVAGKKEKTEKTGRNASTARAERKDKSKKGDRKEDPSPDDKEDKENAENSGTEELNENEKSAEDQE
jgi:small subunit ribosomal protein S3